MRAQERQRGFALPTIVVAGTVLMILLVSTMSILTSVRVALSDQYYNQLAHEAAESGVAYAKSCIGAGAMTWSDASPLRPNTTCAGGAACTGASSCYVMNGTNVRTSFQIGATTGPALAKQVRAVGIVEIVRTSSGTVAQAFTQTVRAVVNVATAASRISFGNYGPGDPANESAYFFTQDNDNVLRGVGGNNYGQLALNNTTNQLAPVSLNLLSGANATRAFTSFVSMGKSVIFSAGNGLTYAAGANNAGQLGIGSTTNAITPTRVSGLPAAAEPIVAAVINGEANYILGADHNIYAAGDCSDGRIGSPAACGVGNIIKTYRRVALPAYNAGNPATIPTTKFVADARSAYVVMQGGQVYGWGWNAFGQLNLPPTDIVNDPYGSVPHFTATPTRIGVFGDAGQPQAVQVATDGITTWVVDSNGDLWTTGENQNGQLAGKGIEIRMRNKQSGSVCLDNDSGNNTTVHLWGCLKDTNSTQAWTFYEDNTIRLTTNSGSTICIASTGTTPASPLKLTACNSGDSLQKFETVSAGDTSMKIRLKNYPNLCIDNVNYSTDYDSGGDVLRMHTCNGSNAQNFTLPSMGYNQWESAATNPHHLYRVYLPAAAGPVVKVATDQWFISILDSNGAVWSTGLNNAGQLGNGTTSDYQPFAVKFNVPAGTVINDAVSTCLYCETTDYPGTYVISTTGNIYAAGSNKFGQLGTGSMSPASSATPLLMLPLKDNNNLTVLPAPATDRLVPGGSSLQAGFGTVVIFGADGKVYTLGNNRWGQLGDGTTTNSATPKANQFTNPPRPSIYY